MNIVDLIIIVSPLWAIAFQLSSIYKELKNK